MNRLGILKDGKLKIAYKIQANGQATDLRFETANYVAEAGEMLLEGDVLPPIESLHGIDYLKNLKISEAKKMAGDKIQNYYKQININEMQGYSQSDKDAMWRYINSIRNASDTIASKIKALSDADEIMNFDIANCLRDVLDGGDSNNADKSGSW